MVQEINIATSGKQDLIKQDTEEILQSLPRPENHENKLEPIWIKVPKLKDCDFNVLERKNTFWNDRWYVTTKNNILFRSLNGPYSNQLVVCNKEGELVATTSSIPTSDSYYNIQIETGTDIISGILYNSQGSNLVRIDTNTLSIITNKPLSTSSNAMYKGYIGLDYSILTQSSNSRISIYDMNTLNQSGYPNNVTLRMFVSASSYEFTVHGYDGEFMYISVNQDITSVNNVDYNGEVKKGLFKVKANMKTGEVISIVGVSSIDNYTQFYVDLEKRYYITSVTNATAGRYTSYIGSLDDFENQNISTLSVSGKTIVENGTALGSIKSAGFSQRAYYENDHLVTDGHLYLTNMSGSYQEYKRYLNSLSLNIDLEYSPATYLINETTCLSIASKDNTGRTCNLLEFENVAIFGYQEVEK